jgi:hypothetical protein
MNDLPEIYRKVDRKVDLTVFGLANLFTFIMVIVFLAQVRGSSHIGFIGVLWGAFVLVLTVIAAQNARAGRKCWTIALPAMLPSF